jgi:hypothetical protein
MSFIVNLNTGTPVNIPATWLEGATVRQTGLYANAVPDVVGPFSAKNFGKVRWDGDYGAYFNAGEFTKVADPQCLAVSADLRQYCTLQAVADAKTGQILLQNPKPGTRGNLGQQTMELPGQWSFDTQLSKTVRIAESKTLQIRLDAQNVLNHPNVGIGCTAATGPQCNPNLNPNDSNPFGFIQSKGDQRRQFKAMLRFNF